MLTSLSIAAGHPGPQDTQEQGAARHGAPLREPEEAWSSIQWPPPVRDSLGCHRSV